jgi:ABC-type dipeptide/oligopeptide/nickel transport system permease component
MLRYIAYRLFYALLVIWGSLTLVFLIVRVIPGDPGRMYAGPLATQEQVAAARSTLGLDRSLIQQYFDFIGDAVTLDLGRSYRLGTTVTELLADRTPATVLLAVTAMSLGVVISFPLGILAARYRARRPDRLISLLSLLGQAVPNFWLGIVAILIFSVTLQWLPTGGSGSLTQLIMPSLVLSAPLIGVLVRLIRAGLIDVMEEPYILTARSKGLNHNIILFRHALKNMLIPVITVMGIQLGQLLSGAVIVEVVFAWPGLGRLLVDAITSRDFPVVQAVILFVAVVMVLLNLIVDLLYGVLDPRIRLEAAR